MISTKEPQAHGGLADSIIVRWLTLFLFLGLVARTIINYAPHGLAWDEAYYLHRAVCMNRAIYELDSSSIFRCLDATHKGPIVEVLALPWGRAGGTHWGIGLAFVGLAIFVWIMALLTYLISVHGGIPKIALLLAAFTICLTPFLRLNAGDMMTDTLLGWSIALSLMLIPVEYNRRQTNFWPGILRGLLWGFVIDVGMLSKVTFGFFLISIGLLLLAIRWKRSGIRALPSLLLGCTLGSVPAILIWVIYGRNFLNFAILAARDLASLYSVPGMTAVDYWKRYFSELGWSLIPLLVLLALFIRGLWIEKERRFIRLLPLAIVLGYLAIASMTQNRDPRFTIPVMIAMPLCLAWNNPNGTSSETAIRPTPILASLLVGTLFAIPMVGRPDIAPIERAGELLKNLSQGRPTTVLLATDGVFFNVETVELARQIGGDYLRPVRVETLVYDEVNKRSVEDGLSRISNANYVLFLKPGNPPGPDWTMTRTKDYRAHCEKVGTLMSGQISPDFDVFKVH